MISTRVTSIDSIAGFVHATHQPTRRQYNIHEYLTWWEKLTRFPRKLNHLHENHVGSYISKFQELPLESLYIKGKQRVMPFGVETVTWHRILTL